MTINDVLHTEFIQNLTEESHRIIQSIPEKNGYSLKENNSHLLTVNEQKTLRISNLVNNLTTVLNDIRIIYILINKLPPKVYLEKHDLSELEYVKFHTESFLHKVSTIHDLMGLIVNELLNLGIPQRNCNWKNLTKHQNFNESRCKVFIEEYYRDFSYLIELRNLNSHRGLFNDDKMDRIGNPMNIYRQYKRLGMELDEDFKKTTPLWLVNYMFKEFKKERLQEIKKVEQKIFRCIKNFLAVLEWKN